MGTNGHIQRAAVVYASAITVQLVALPTMLPAANIRSMTARNWYACEEVCDAVEHVDECLLGNLTGDYGCVSVEPVYYGEIFTNVRGGLANRRAMRYQALLDLPITVDLEKIQSCLPGKFVLLGQNTHGRGLTEDIVGDTQVLSNIDSFKNVTRVSEYWWEFNLSDETLTVRLGKQDVNTEFFFIEVAADFIQSTFGLTPSTAFPTYPDQSMAAVVLAQLTDSWRLKFGVWDAFSAGGNWGFSGNDAVLVIGELEKQYTLLDGSLPGTFVIGAVYEAAGELSGESVSAVHEYIVQLEQQIYQENCCNEEDNQGLSVFAGYYPRSPGRLITADSIGDSLVAGFVYQGLIPSHDEDVVGAAVSWVELFQGGTNREMVFEFFYKAQISPHFSLQPDLQYIATPSGIYRDALAAGVRFEMAL